MRSPSAKMDELDGSRARLLSFPFLLFFCIWSTKYIHCDKHILLIFEKCSWHISKMFM